MLRQALGMKSDLHGYEEQKAGTSIDAISEEEALQGIVCHVLGGTGYNMLHKLITFDKYDGVDVRLHDLQCTPTAGKMRITFNETMNGLTFVIVKGSAVGSKDNGDSKLVFGVDDISEIRTGAWTKEFFRGRLDSVNSYVSLVIKASSESEMSGPHPFLGNESKKETVPLKSLEGNECPAPNALRSLNLELCNGDDAAILMSVAFCLSEVMKMDPHISPYGCHSNGNRPVPFQQSQTIIHNFYNRPFTLLEHTTLLEVLRKQASHVTQILRESQSEDTVRQFIEKDKADVRKFNRWRCFEEWRFNGFQPQPSGSDKGEEEDCLQHLSVEWIETIVILTRIPPAIYFEDSRSRRAESLLSGMLQVGNSLEQVDPYFQKDADLQIVFTDDAVTSPDEGTTTTRTHALRSAAKEIAVSLHSPGGLPRFVRALNQRRCKNSDIGAAYPFIAGLLLSLLNKCWDDNAVDPVLNTMMLAQSFYRFKGVDGDVGAEDPQTITQNDDCTQEKQFLKTALETHPLWRSSAFWQGALELGIAKNADMASSEKDVNDPCTFACAQAITEEYVFSSLACWQKGSEKHLTGKTFEVEDTMIRKKIIFGQMSGLVHAMLEFKVSTEEVLIFINRVCTQNGLSDEQRTDINRHVYAHCEIDDANVPL